MIYTCQLQHQVHTKTTPTDRTMQVAAMFGLSLDATAEHTIIPPIQIPCVPGQIIFVTGVSGGGKSTLLRLIQSQLKTARETAPGLICTGLLPKLPDEALVDAISLPEADTDQNKVRSSLGQTCRWLSLAGLNDAAVMLRKPNQLSVGQRHRLKLAQAIAMAERSDSPWSVLLADEFASSLDRTTAYALARSTRRWVSKSNICLIAATAHDDLLEPLSPNVLVELSPGGRCQVHHRPEEPNKISPQ